MNSFLFTKDQEKNKRIWSAFKTNIKIWNNNGKDFDVTISEHKRIKSWRQLKGLYRLLGKIVPVLKDVDPSTYFDVEKVKIIIKDLFGYYDTYNGIKLYKSCKDATIEDMIGLIKTAEKFGDEMGVKDCFLTSEETIALNEYYGK